MNARLAAALVVLCWPGFAGADRITLSSGRTIDGRVVARSQGYVTIEADGMVTRLREEMVRSVEEVAGYENTLIRAKSALKRRDGARGLEALLAASREGAPAEDIRLALVELNGGVSGAIYKATPAERPELRKAIRDLVESDLLTSRTLFLSSQNLFQLEDWDGAADTLERIPADDIAADLTMRQWSLEFMRQVVKRQVARGDFESAIGSVERMRRLSGDSGSPEVPLALLASAAAARDRNDYGRAFELLAGPLREASPEIARNRALHAIAHLRAWAERTGKLAEARDAIAPLARAFPVEYAAARTALLRAQAQKALDSGETAMVARIIGTIPEEERTADLKALYNAAFHEAELLRIGESDPLELVKHGRWCVENGLLDEAIAIFDRTRANASLRDVSDQLLDNTRRERDTRLLEEAQQFYELGNLGECTARTRRILEQRTGDSLAAEARKLDDVAQASMKRAAERRPYQAEVFFQQAERAYFLQNHEEALKLANLVLSQYADTPAAARAAQLLADVVRALELAYLEGRVEKLPPLDEAPLATLQRADKLDEEIRRLMGG